MYYYRTHDGAECDLVLVKGVKPLACIEIKLNNAPMCQRAFMKPCKTSIRSFVL